MRGDKAGILENLRRDIQRLQGCHSGGKIQLGVLDSVLPEGSFPLGAVHEFLSSHAEGYAATAGFISTLLGQVMGNHGAAAWISTSRNIFAPAFRSFGVKPDRILFIDLKNESDVLWAVEESLKCEALSAVVGEVNELTFTASRRLQLAVEKSRVTGFMIRRNCKKLNTTVCVSRWRITPRPSLPIDDLPGIGFPGWHVELLRMRNGRPGNWTASWAKNRLEIYPTQPDPETKSTGELPLIKTG